MHCPACGADVREGQKFCMECGASLRGVADVTGEVPITRGPATPEPRLPAGAPLPPPELTIAQAGDASATGLAELVAPPEPDATWPLATPAAGTSDAPPDAPPADPDATTRMPAVPREHPAGQHRAARTGPGADADITAPLAATAPADPDATTRLPATPHRDVGRVQERPRRPGEDPAAAESTGRLALVGHDRPDPAAEHPRPERSAPQWIGGETPAAVAPLRQERRFRLRPMLVLAVLAAAAAATAAVVNMITIETDVDTPLFEIGDWRINDFGTNNTVAALVAAGTMVLGALAWCWRARWGAGLAGGAGAALAGWSALVIGLAEWPISRAVDATATAGGAVTITRDLGYWAVGAAGGLGALVFLVSLVRAGRDGHAGLDPWVAALGAASALLAAGGPLIPRGDASFSANYQSTTVDLPTAFFAGRLVQVGLVALCGVVGFLLVRRFGLGLAIGGAVAAGWMVLTAATEQTASPIGPAYANPGASDLRPHAVTVVGMALLGFFAVVAVVMALLDSDR